MTMKAPSVGEMSPVEAQAFVLTSRLSETCSPELIHRVVLFAVLETEMFA